MTPTEIALAIGNLVLPVLTYFAGVQREKQRQTETDHAQRAQRVVDAYLGIKQRRTGIHDLINAGVLTLSDPNEIMMVCRTISEHGHPSPLHNLATELEKEIPQQDILTFLRWFNSRHDLMDTTTPFHNERNFNAMISEFRQSLKQKD